MFKLIANRIVINRCDASEGSHWIRLIAIDKMMGGKNVPMKRHHFRIEHFAAVLKLFLPDIDNISALHSASKNKWNLLDELDAVAQLNTQ